MREIELKLLEIHKAMYEICPEIISNPAEKKKPHMTKPKRQRPPSTRIPPNRPTNEAVADRIGKRVWVLDLPADENSNDYREVWEGTLVKRREEPKSRVSNKRNAGQWVWEIGEFPPSRFSNMTEYEYTKSSVLDS
jgi:hypothetical protein